MLASGTFVGYLVILIAVFAGLFNFSSFFLNYLNIINKKHFDLFLGNLINTPINKRLDLFYSLVGCAMFIATGVLVLKEWEDAVFKTDRRKMAIAKGSLSIVNGVLFLIDAVLAFRD